MRSKSDCATIQLHATMVVIALAATPGHGRVTLECPAQWTGTGASGPSGTRARGWGKQSSAPRKAGFRAALGAASSPGTVGSRALTPPLITKPATTSTCAYSRKATFGQSGVSGACASHHVESPPEAEPGSASLSCPDIRTKPGSRR